MAKTFETLFKLKAKYEGKPAFNSLNKDLDKTQRNVKNTGSAFGRVFGRAGSIVAALGATAAAFYAFRKAVDLGKWAYDAAKEQQKAHDLVRTSTQRMIDQGRLNAKQLESHTQKVIALGEAMNKAGGLDAETLEGGLAELSKAFTFKQIEGMSKGYQDWMVRLHKGAPTMEQAIEDANKLTEFVFRGKARPLVDMGLTKKQVEALNELETPQERVIALQKIIGQQTGETAAWMKTAAGAEYQATNAAQDLGETAMKPLVEAQKELNIALKDLYVALQPVAELIAKQMTPYVQNLTKYIQEHKKEIAAWGETAVTWITKIIDFFIWLQAKSEEHLHPIWKNTVKEWNAILGALDTFWTNIDTGASRAYDGIITIWNQMTGYFTGLIPKVEVAIAPIFDTIIKPFKMAYDWVISLFNKLGIDIERVVREAAEGTSVPATTGEGVGGGGMATEFEQFEEQQKRGGGGFGINPDAMKTSATGPVSNAGLAGIRAPFAQELATDPAAKARYYAKVKAEVGNQGLDAIQKQMETMENRAYLRNLTVKQVSTQGGKAGRYWGSGYKRLSAEEQKVYDLAASRVHAGSNASNLATGNESAGLRNGPVVSTARGERFVIEPADAKRHHRLREAAKDMNQSKTSASGPVNVTMNSPITVNGVAAGSENLVAERVKRARRDPDRDLLAGMHRIQNREVRGSYNA